jgi:peptidoglycan/xylan/chitin deacetylase (PgdA/CDA1 family)
MTPKANASGGRERGDRRVAILAFHKVGEPPAGAWPTWNYVPLGRFAALLSLLRDEGWPVIDLATFISGLANAAELPPRSALLTFDDGYRSTLTEASPCLLGFGYPAVVFVPTGYIGGRNDFDRGVEPEERICDWDDLRELDRRGVSVQSHGVSHRWYSTLDPAELRDELVRSKEALEDGLSKRVEVLAYPYGDAGRDPGRMAALLRETGYRAGCLYGGGPNRRPVADACLLSRLAIGPDSDLRRLLEAS